MLCFESADETVAFLNAYNLSVSSTGAVSCCVFVMHGSRELSVLKGQRGGCCAGEGVKKICTGCSLRFARRILSYRRGSLCKLCCCGCVNHHAHLQRSWPRLTCGKIGATACLCVLARLRTPPPSPSLGAELFPQRDAAARLVYMSVCNTSGAAEVQRSRRHVENSVPPTRPSPRGRRPPGPRRA